MEETVTIENCSACKGDHPDLAFRRLDPPDMLATGVFDHVTTCPITGREIVFRVLAEYEATPPPVGVVDGG